MGYINESFESRYNRKNNVSLNLFFFSNIFFQTAAELKIYSDNLTQ